MLSQPPFDHLIQWIFRRHSVFALFLLKEGFSGDELHIPADKLFTRTKSWSPRCTFFLQIFIKVNKRSRIIFQAILSKLSIILFFEVSEANQLQPPNFRFCVATRVELFGKNYKYSQAAYQKLNSSDVNCSNQDYTMGWNKIFFSKFKNQQVNFFVFWF